MNIKLSWGFLVNNLLIENNFFQLVSVNRINSLFITSLYMISVISNLKISYGQFRILTGREIKGVQESNWEVLEKRN